MDEVAPITGCVRADVEARKLLNTIRTTVDSGRRVQEGGLSEVRLSEHLQNSFRGQQSLVNENAMLTVRIEQLVAELAESRRLSHGGRDLQVRVRSLEAERERLKAYWKDRLQADQTRVAELEADQEGTRLANEALETQLRDRDDAIRSKDEMLRQREAELERASARITVLEQQQDVIPSHARSPFPLPQGRSPAKQVPSIRAEAVASATGVHEAGAQTQFHQGVPHDVLVELETLREHLKVSNMQVEAMKARAEGKEILAAEAVKRAERTSKENINILKSLNTVHGETEKIHSLEEQNGKLEERVAELSADRKCLQQDRDSRSVLVTALQERLASESREVTSCRLALESAKRRCESATRELDVRVRRDASSDERFDLLRSQLEEMQDKLVSASQAAAESNAKNTALEAQVCAHRSPLSLTRSIIRISFRGLLGGTHPVTRTQCAFPTFL